MEAKNVRSAYRARGEYILTRELSTVDDTFMCQKCDAQYHPPEMATSTPTGSLVPAVAANAGRHTYMHALVRLTLPSVISGTTEVTSTEQWAEGLEKKVLKIGRAHV